MKTYEFTPQGTTGCSVKAWLHYQNGSESVKQRIHPAVIVCPGGGYAHVSDREAEPVARAYFAAGYNTYILTYTVGEAVKGFTPLKQLAATIADIRANAEEWFTAKEQIAVCGFSAGGHLAASLGTLFNEEKFLQAFDSSPVPWRLLERNRILRLKMPLKVRQKSYDLPPLFLKDLLALLLPVHNPSPAWHSSFHRFWLHPNISKS